MSQHQKLPKQRQQMRPTSDFGRTNELLLSDDGLTSSTTTKNDIGIVTSKQPQLYATNVNVNTTIGDHQIIPALQSPSTNKTFPNEILPINTGDSGLAHIDFSSKHSDQIVEITKENDETAASQLNITPAQLVVVEDNNSAGKTSSWKLADRPQSGEENILLGEQSTTATTTTSLDRVIIGSLLQQQSQHTLGGSSVGVGAAAAATRRLNQARNPSGNTTASGAANPIQISDKAAFQSAPSIAQLAQKSTLQRSITTVATAAAASGNPADSKRLRFKSLLDTTAAAGSSAAQPVTVTSTTTTTCDSSSGELNSSVDNSIRPDRLLSALDRISHSSSCSSDRYEFSAHRKREEILLDTLHEDTREEEEDYRSGDEHDDDDDDEDGNDRQSNNHNQIGQFEIYSKLNSRRVGNSVTFRKSTSRLFGGQTFIRLQRLLGVLNSKLIDSNYKETPYVHYESKDLLTGDSKYPSSSSSLAGRERKRHPISGKSFRGSYRYSRAEISMAIFKKLINLLFQKSTLALIGAFLIHITLGTVYTLSNINSYLTSYMRLHGSPTLTYGGSMWISSFYAVGQGFSMVLGGYLEKRFSARLACFLGCLIHSGSIMSTSWSVNHGSLAVLMSYGFLPGFGCGLAYMTPMSNGFGWFPNRRGLVAGVILAGFGIGTFVFNIAQTAYVNPNNLSPPENASGYFTQESILTKVPGLFLFIGSIYAAMQFVGCCLLFKPPSSSDYSAPGKSPDERPILETEMSVGRAVRTREFAVLFLVYGIITQGVLFVNSMIKEYGQLFIGDDMYLAWTGSMASIANALGRLLWGLAIDRYSFTQCFTCITSIFGLLMFLMPFEFVLSSKQLYLLCTLGIFGSFSGWMSTFPVHLSRTFGRLNSGMLYGLIFISQSFGGVGSAFGAHYLIDHYSRFVPFFCVVLLEILGLAIYHLFYPKHRYL